MKQTKESWGEKCKSIYEHSWGYQELGGFPGHPHTHPSGEHICMRCGIKYSKAIHQLLAKEREEFRGNIGLLRQWLNERTDDKLLTNEVLEFWLFGDEPKVMINTKLKTKEEVR